MGLGRRPRTLQPLPLSPHVSLSGPPLPLGRMTACTPPPPPFPPGNLRAYLPVSALLSSSHSQSPFRRVRSVWGPGRGLPQVFVLLTTSLLCTSACDAPAFPPAPGGSVPGCLCALSGPCGLPGPRVSPDSRALPAALSVGSLPVPFPGGSHLAQPGPGPWQAPVPSGSTTRPPLALLSPGLGPPLAGSLS